MFEKCIKCERLGESCVPNLMLLDFPKLMEWCKKRQKHLEWTNQTLAEKSRVPIGTINRIKAGDYLDCKYSTIRALLITLIGGTTDEFSCTEQIEREMKQLEQSAQQDAAAKENELLKAELAACEAQHRADIRAIRNEYREQIEFLKDELKAWRSLKER